MAIPNDASIFEVGKELGLSEEQLDNLTERAKQLTKGDLLALLGTETNRDAVVVYSVTSAGALLPKPTPLESIEDLTIRDRASLGEVFGPVAERAMKIPVLSERGVGVVSRVGTGFDKFDPSAIDISCCSCCPCTCCCAAAVAQPARAV